MTDIKPDRQPILVKLSGIRFPEASHPLGEKARAALQALIMDQNVRLEEVRIDPMDKYKRTLATVYNAEDIHVNQSMINQGYTIVEPTEADPLLLSLQDMAAQNKVGLWSSEYPSSTKQWQKQNQVAQPKIKEAKPEYRLVSPKPVTPKEVVAPKKTSLSLIASRVINRQSSSVAVKPPAVK